MDNLFLVVLSIYSTNIFAETENVFIVQLKNGVVRGEEMTGENGNLFYAFRGIPYAEPPVGNLRFKPPVRRSPWKGILNATKDGPHCSQMNYVLMKYRGSEDCLYLNVYTPKLYDSKSNMNVIFHIHGGGFVTGDGGTFFYGPRRLLLRDVILVSPTYRVGPLGFFSSGDSSSPGNYGLLDQLEALHWVKENIHHFGGDSSKVTLLGESAGGASVIYHFTSPLSKGLFHRAIAMSGSSLCPWALQRDPVHWAKKLAEDFNCSMQNSSTFVDCLRQQSAEEITLKGSPVLRDLFYLSFTPTVDNYFVEDFPLNLIIRRKHDEKIPLLIGVTKDEANCKLLKRETDEDFTEDEILDILKSTVEFRPNVDQIVKRIKEEYFSATISNYSRESIQGTLAKALTDGMFHKCIVRTAKLIAENGNKVYFYSYDYEAPFSISQLYGKTEKYGVCHMDDLFMLFDGFIFGRASFTKESLAMRERFQELLLNFVKSGNPIEDDDNDEFCEWPTSHSKAIFVYHINEKCSIELYDQAKDYFYSFWNKIIEENYWKTQKVTRQSLIFTKGRFDRHGLALKIYDLIPIIIKYLFS